MTSELGAKMVTLTDHLLEDLGQARRDAANASALAVVTAARKAERAAIGPEQRLSGVRTRYRQTARGVRRRKVGAATMIAGGTRVNPYYRDATSVINPVALIGVRGPADYVEHPTRNVSRPLAPVTRTFDRAGAVIQDKAADALYGTLTRKGW